MAQQLGARGMGMSGAWLTGQQSLYGQEEAAKTKAINDLIMRDQELKAQRAAANAQLLGGVYTTATGEAVATMQAEKAYAIWEAEFGPNLAAQGQDMAIAAKKAGIPWNVAQKQADAWVQKWGPVTDPTSLYVDNNAVPPEVQSQKPWIGTTVVYDDAGNAWSWDGTGWKILV